MGELQEAAVIIQEATKHGGAALRAVTTGYGRRSISRLAKDAIFQMPMMISSDIDADEVPVIAHGFEKEYAAFIVSAISLDHNVDRTKYGNTRDFLKTFHSNSSIPAAVYNSGNLVMESATVAEEGSIYVDPVMMASLWTSKEDRYDTGVINDMYLPFNRTARKLQDRINMAIATEAKGKDKDPSEVRARAIINEQVKRDAMKRDIQIANGGTHVAKDKFDEELGLDAEKRDFYNRHPYIEDAKDDLKGYGATSQFTIPIDSKKNEIRAKESKYDMMEPTLININLTNYNGQSVWSDAITIGVKCMLRIVPSSQMTANMVDACEDRPIFKMIKWTKGEYNLFDILFGKSKYKKMGIDNAKGKWLAALKKRATIDNISRFTGSRLLPTATIVMTETEVMEVKRICGVDLHDMRTVNQIFKKYFLLGFGIYDTNTRILSAVFDGDNNFTQVSLRSLAGEIKKSTDLLTSTRRF